MTILSSVSDDREPVYEISDRETETLIALTTRPMRYDDTAEGWSSPQNWLADQLAEIVGDQANVNDDTKIYVASSYDEAKHIASQHNLKMLSSH
tara:strand:- start:1017 stop:1298 length:282 start_codon:yes stop_codon:yes gene_type:complete